MKKNIYPMLCTIILSIKFFDYILTLKRNYLANQLSYKLSGGNGTQKMVILVILRDIT